jgi:hypothetical protein|tara:strand:+ start:79 stop:270 length:192 start_codon:yes stop_codon:yes gene_type:complete
MSWWKKVTNFLQWSVSNDTKDVEVVEETEMETVRARNKKGRYLADDKSTPDVNEAYVKRKKKK